MALPQEVSNILKKQRNSKTSHAAFAVDPLTVSISETFVNADPALLAIGREYLRLELSSRDAPVQSMGNRPNMHYSIETGADGMDSRPDADLDEVSDVSVVVTACQSDPQPT